jgi:hypothetical protein
MAGVALRIAHKVAERLDRRPCHNRVGHNEGYSVGYRYGQRVLKNSFLFGTIRDPAKRALSRVFFTSVSNGRKRPTDANIKKGLNGSDSRFGSISPGLGGFQLAYLSMTSLEKYSVWKPDQPTVVSDPDLVHETVQRILQDYDLMILVERFDESMVVMQMMLGLETSDMLYLSSKQAGSYSGEQCRKLKKAYASKGIAAHLSSEEWYAKSYGDYVLWEATSQSLDLTIEALGKDKFKMALQKYVDMRRQAEEQCAPTAIWPCSKDGKPQVEESKSNCYKKDWGCGFPCFEAVFGGSEE